mmetsp:Transcript_44597/g.73825  ORF Transcript_44597/g.73825 Transcript_44597/m.73825 type:complete len:287 (+) Transcript_44597:20-880(+)
MGNFVEWATADNGDDEDWTEQGRHDDDSDGDFPFSNIDLSHSNKYDCVVVFDDGHRSTEWSYKLYDTLTFNYLDLLDADDIEQRKNRFPHQGADWSTSSSSSMLSVHDFNKNERKLVIKALKKIDIDCKSIHSLNRRISSQFHHNNTITTTTATTTTDITTAKSEHKTDGIVCLQCVCLHATEREIVVATHIAIRSHTKKIIVAAVLDTKNILRCHVSVSVSVIHFVDSKLPCNRTLRLTCNRLHRFQFMELAKFHRVQHMSRHQYTTRTFISNTSIVSVTLDDVE